MSRYLAWIDTPLNKQIEMVEHLKYAGVVVPVEPDWPRIEKQVCQRIHAHGPAMLNARDRTQLARAMDDIRAGIGGETDDAS